MNGYSYAATMPTEMGVQVLPAGTYLAPSPAIDKWPIVQGSNLTLAYLSSAYRLATQGYRYAYVDVVNELLEMDPHAHGVVRQRILPVAGARLEVLPAELPKDDPDTKKAHLIAEEVGRQLSNLPSRAQSLGALAWAGTLHGVGACELDWRQTSLGWELKGLRFIHTRRLNYTESASWDLHIWDMGTVGPALTDFATITGGTFGLRCRSFPGKFIQHTPQLAGDYPTRNGEARFISFYMALKRTVVRATAMDFERTIRPWIVGTFARDPAKKSDDPKSATKEDIQKLEAAVRALGLGSLNSAVIADTCKIEILRAASEYSPKEFIDFLDEQISKSVLGQTFTTQPGQHGNKSAAETAKDGTREILRYDAQCLADSLERDVVYWIVKLNFPGCEERLCPRIFLNIDEAIDPEELAALAVKLTSIDAPIDLRDLSKRVGLKLADPDDPNALRSRMVTAGKGPTPTGEEMLSVEPASGDEGKTDTKASADKPPARRTPPRPSAADDEPPLQDAAE